ncbi:GntR family transcriptional regulator [Acidipila rosea]|uniref:GntR family transcriptional regulator n=1 Tax=Acidipila rosea TaxID=768535 RepID=A0A4R1L176_9BACT|nr:GntR family transcriptional regulator [Acidipila rosea]TCK70757.1 GntR family transcriptional regulator [Acidipila rosea]
MVYVPNAVRGEAALLAKQSLATKLREEIIHGHLIPGQRIVEGYWARKFGVAQTSVREAINILISEGFVTKASGRSARVTSYTEADIAQIYELRVALEGLAARLAAQRHADLAPLKDALKEMRRATRQGQIRLLIEADLRFHLCLCELSGNHLLYTQMRTLLVPLFAFVSMRAIQVNQTVKAWESDLDRHKRIVDLILDGDPDAAEFTMRSTLQRFAARAHSVWQETR